MTIGGSSLKDSHLKDLGVKSCDSPSKSLQDILVKGDVLARVTECDKVVVDPLLVSSHGMQMYEVLVDMTSGCGNHIT